MKVGDACAQEPEQKKPVTLAEMSAGLRARIIGIGDKLLARAELLQCPSEKDPDWNHLQFIHNAARIAGEFSRVMEWMDDQESEVLF